MNLLDRGPQPVGRPGDERRVERARDLELDRPAGSFALRLLDALLDGEILAGDDDLSRAVVVGRPDPEDLAAQSLDHLVGQTEDGGHRAGIAGGCVGHGQATLAHERHRFLEGHRLGRGECGELSDRVADDEVGLDAPVAQSCEHRERRRDERRLLHRRVEQLLGLGVETEALEVEPARLAAAPEDVHRGRHRFGEIAAHSGLERALSGEAEGDLAHFPVQRIKALPHVSPAPIPVINTRLPARSLPSASASTSARGIEPEDVLP